MNGSSKRNLLEVKYCLMVILASVTFLFLTPAHAQQYSFSYYFPPLPFSGTSLDFYSPYSAPAFLPAPAPVAYPYPPVYSLPLMASPGFGLSPLLAAAPAISPISRSAAATTIVVLPTAQPVTASAPLGTFSITPSTLIFLFLYLTVH